MYFFSSPMLCFAEVSHTRALGEKDHEWVLQSAKAWGPLPWHPWKCPGGSGQLLLLLSCYSSHREITD